MPLDDVQRKPRTSLFGELHVNEIDSETNLPIVNWCEWQPCHCDELGTLLYGHFCFAQSESDGDSTPTAADEDAELRYLVMISAEGYNSVMLGQWDGRRRDQNTGLPVVELFTFPSV